MCFFFLVCLTFCDPILPEFALFQICLKDFGLTLQILDTNPQLFFHLQQQRLIELIRSGQVEEALEFAQEELAPRGEENVYRDRERVGGFCFWFAKRKVALKRFIA